MVHPEQRDAEPDRQRLRGRHPDGQRTGQPRTGGDGDGVDVREPDAGRAQARSIVGTSRLQMCPAGHLGHHAAEPGVLVDGGGDRVDQQLLARGPDPTPVSSQEVSIPSTSGPSAETVPGGSSPADATDAAASSPGQVSRSSSRPARPSPVRRLQARASLTGPPAAAAAAVAGASRRHPPHRAGSSRGGRRSVRTRAAGTGRWPWRCRRVPPAAGWSHPAGSPPSISARSSRPPTPRPWAVAATATVCTSASLPDTMSPAYPSNTPSSPAAAPRSTGAGVVLPPLGGSRVVLPPLGGSRVVLPPLGGSRVVLPPLGGSGGSRAVGFDDEVPAGPSLGQLRPERLRRPRGHPEQLPLRGQQSLDVPPPHRPQADRPGRGGRDSRLPWTSLRQGRCRAGQRSTRLRAPGSTASGRRRYSGWGGSSRRDRSRGSARARTAMSATSAALTSSGSTAGPRTSGYSRGAAPHDLHPVPGNRRRDGDLGAVQSPNPR